MYSHDYTTDYQPAMPLIEIEIGLERGSSVLSLPAIVDSGADATMVPLHYLHRMGAIPSTEKWLRGITEGRYRVELYTIFVQIGSYGLYVAAVGDQLNDEVIVGRDVLNQFIVTLNGLASIIKISQ